NYTCVVTQMVFAPAGGCPRRNSGTARGMCRMADGGAPMGALRKAGVWLGLVEEDDDRTYGERGGYRGYGGEFAGDAAVDEAPVPARARVSERLEAARAGGTAERAPERTT